MSQNFRDSVTKEQSLARSVRKHLVKKKGEASQLNKLFSHSVAAREGLWSEQAKPLPVE